ncbi:WD40 repeat domain-containing protein [Frankia sp. Cj3]|uniref:NACHT and WD repeat domain-containing protein n=1 Tax=Frankia sp. Cj3 TaxID=2880976 RepID=UPI001EF6427D|nr:WD40 repeat domain-containing protein [Frankia sp. Cj3]
MTRDREMPVRVGDVAAQRGGQAVGVNYGQVLHQWFAGSFRLLRQATIPLDPLPGDLRLVDPAQPDNPVSRFRGRKDLIARIDEFISRCVQLRRGGYLLVEAEAGMGKSALATYLAFTRAWPAHFTRLAEGRSPQIARRNLAAQLIAQWKLDDAAPGGVLPDAADTTTWLYGRLCEAAASRDRHQPGTPVVLLVDGLDEAPPALGGELPLGLPPSLPPGTVIVATTRPKTVAIPAGSRVVERIDVESAANREDLLDYLTLITGTDPQLADAMRASDLTASRFCQTLLNRSGGVWIYALTVLDQIRDGRRQPTEVDQLPVGLAGYYADNLARWRAELGESGWRMHGLPVLTTLTAIREPQPAAAIAEWARVPEDEVRKLLRGIFRPFLALRAGGDPDRYLPRHQSLRDFCAGTSLQDMDDEDLRHLAFELAAANKSAHQRITAALIPAGARDERIWQETSNYAVAYLPEHAALAGVLDDLVNDPGFLLACHPGNILRHRRRLQTAEGVAAVNAYEQAIDEWPAHPSDEQLWWLHIWARKVRAHALAASCTRQVSRPWVVTTAMWTGIPHRILTGHTGVVRALAPVPLSDGRTLISSADDEGVVWVWDPISGQQVKAPLTGHTATIRALIAVPLSDGRTFLASGSADGTVRIWDPVSGQLACAPLDGHVDVARVLAVLHLPDGRTLLASGDAEGTVRLWDPIHGMPAIRRLKGHRSAIRALISISLPDGRIVLASAGDDKTIRLWDPVSGRPFAEPLAGHDHWVLTLAAVPLTDGRTLLASGDDQGIVQLWDPVRSRLATGPLIAETDHLIGLGESIWALTVVPGPDGRALLASAGEGPDVYLWDPTDGRLVATLEGHTDAVGSLAVVSLPDGRNLLASASDDETVRLWDPVNGQSATDPLIGHVDPVGVLTAVPLPDGRTLLASAGNDRTVRLWDPAQAQVADPLTGHAGAVLALVTVPLPDARILLASASADGSVRLWDPISGQAINEPLTGHAGAVTSLAAIPFSDGRTLLASGGQDKMIRLWDPSTGCVIRILAGHTDWVQALAVIPLPGGRTVLASAGDDETVRLWDPLTGEPATRPLLGHTNWVRALAAVPIPDGRVLLASGGVDRTVRLWDPSTGKLAAGPLSGYTDWVRALAAVPLPNGRTLLVSGSDDRAARLRDPDYGHIGPVRTVAAVPQHNGRMLLASGGDDGVVRLWDALTGQPTATPLIGHTGPVRTVTPVPRPDGDTFLASAGDDRTVLIWGRPGRYGTGLG